MTATTEFGLPIVAVTPGQETRTAMTVRNDSDIVEAYGFEVVGECAPWTVVEPSRLSLYPGTSEEVTVVLRPPRSPSVRAGEIPLGVRVLPTERPETASVSEATVVVEPFAEQRAELVPERRRAWRRARYHVDVHNDGNAPVAVTLTAPETDDQLGYDLPARPVTVEPGDRAELELRVRIAKVLWYGKPVEWPLRLDAAAVAGRNVGDDTEEHVLEGELIQLPVFPRWLLALLAALLALLLAWLLLVRPAVESAAREAADDRAEEIAQQEPAPPPQDAPQPGGGDGGQQQETPAEEQQSGAAGGGGGVGQGQQSSITMEVRTNRGRQGVRTDTVPPGKVFRITDIVLANHQGDEGVLTIAFGDRTITTIALETFRNQDYHWVTPIDVQAGSPVTATVECTRPGTPISGRQAPNCFQVLNVSGELVDQPNGN